MVDKNQPVVDSVHCPTYPGPDTWITYPPGWWIEIFGYPPPHRSVENLSTTYVERMPRSSYIRGNTGTFTHLPGVVHIFDRFIHFFDTFHDSNSRTSLTIVPPGMWKVWKTYPPKMWTSGYSHACYVHMWKTCPPRLWKTCPDGSHQIMLKDNMWKVWICYPHKMWINRWGYLLLLFEVSADIMLIITMKALPL